MLVPTNVTPPKEWAINLTLHKSSTKSNNFLKLAFYFTLLGTCDERPLRYDCILTIIRANGKPIAEGMEFPFIPSIANEDGFTTHQIMGNQWTAGKAVHVDVGENDEENLIKLEDVVLKVFRGKCMCKARVVGTGEVFTTEDWDER